MVRADPDEPHGTSRWPGFQPWSWLLLGGNRWAVAALPLVLVFGSMVVLGVLDPVPLRQAIRNSDPVETLFQALVTATVTGVTLVVTINQLVLSQELGAVGDQRQRMEEAMQFRRDVEDELALPVAPAEPAAFLQALVEGARNGGERLEDAGAGMTDAARRARVRSFVDGLVDQSEAVSRRLSDAQFGSFAVVSAALDFDYSSWMHEARRLRGEFDGTAAVTSSLDDLLEVLEFYGAAREHIKTLYFQWALIDLSRKVLYASVPALIVSMGVILFLDDPGTITGSTVGVDNVLLAVSAATAIALSPFTILFAYMLRIATVTKLTLAIGPFLLLEPSGTERRGRTK